MAITEPTEKLERKEDLKAILDLCVYMYVCIHIYFPMIVSYSHHNKIPQTKCFKQQKCTFLQFWRLPVQDQELYRLNPYMGFLL